MSDRHPARPRVYDLDELALRRPAQRIVQQRRRATRFRLAVCAAIGIACGILGWSILGRSSEPTIAVRASAGVAHSPLGGSASQRPPVVSAPPSIATVPGKQRDVPLYGAAAAPRDEPTPSSHGDEGNIPDSAPETEAKRGN